MFAFRAPGARTLRYATHRWRHIATGPCPSTRILDPNRNELLLPLHWRPPCWKRGGEFGQIDDNRWSAIRQGGVPQSRNSLTWGFAGAFFSLRPACRKTARFAPCDHRLSCVCPNSGAFSQQPPSPMPAPLAPPPFPLHRPLPAAVDPYPPPSRLSLFCNVFPSRAHTPQPVAIL